jgi:hypothetical protein
MGKTVLKRVRVQFILFAAAEKRAAPRFGQGRLWLPYRKEKWLFVAQGYHGIDFGGAASGDIAGGERDQSK